MNFTLFLTPRPQLRPRFSRAGIAYKSASQKAAERELDAALWPHRPARALEGPLELRFAAILPIPASASKKRSQAMLEGEIQHTGKPDLDNLAKQLLDALTRTGFWLDDRQAVKISMEKRYGLKPCWIIDLRELEGGRQFVLAAEAA